MIETWQQWTCDGCGETEYTDGPNMTKQETRAMLKAAGWQYVSKGNLDYCPRCVAKGNARKRIVDMNS